MSGFGYRTRILEVASDGAALANSTTPTSILPSAYKTCAFPVGQFDRQIAGIAFDFSGRISTVVTTPGTLTLDLRMGSTAIFSSGAMTLNTTAQTNVHWRLSGELVLRAFGGSTTTTFFPKGCFWDSHAVIGSAAPTAGSCGRHILPYNSAPAVGTGIDNGAAQLIDLYATWSVANASNSITLHCGSVDLYN